MGRPHQTNRPRRSRDLLAPPAGCRFAPIPGSSCSSGQCEPRPETISRLAHRALASPGLALIAIQELRKLCLRRRIGPRVARARRQPAQLYPMQQPVGARQAAINLKLLLQYALRIDRTKRDYPIPLQLGAGDNPSLNRALVTASNPWLATRARPVAQSLNAFLFIAVMESDGTEVFQPPHGERELMRALDERLRKRSSKLSWGTGTGAAADKVLGRSVASSSLALGVLLPQPRWSKSTTRYRCGLKNRADELWLPAPGPPCMTMTGSPASEPYSSQ